MSVLAAVIHVMGLSDEPICRKCDIQEKTSVHALCACVALASLRHSYLGSLLDSEDIRKLNIGVIWKFAKGSGPL
jgi:hypothetical protein